MTGLDLFPGGGLRPGRVEWNSTLSEMGSLPTRRGMTQLGTSMKGWLLSGVVGLGSVLGVMGKKSEIGSDSSQGKGLQAMKTLAMKQLRRMYDFVGKFHRGLARTRKGKKWFHIRHDGKPAYRERYDEVGDFHKDLGLREEGRLVVPHPG